MRDDGHHLGEGATLVTDTHRHDAVRWRCHTRLSRLTLPHATSHKMQREIRELETAGRHGLSGWGAAQHQLLTDLGVEPDDTEISGNLLMYGGASAQWQTLIGNGTTTAGQALTYFNNTQAAVGVGDSSTAEAATQTDLQATTNKIRVAMDSTYPQHTDGVVVGSASIAFRATFGTAVANWAWAEWGIFNSASAGTGRMLNRKVASLGTKTSSSSWQLTLTLSLA